MAEFRIGQKPNVTSTLTTDKFPLERSGAMKHINQSDLYAEIQALIDDSLLIVPGTVDDSFKIVNTASPNMATDQGAFAEGSGTTASGPNSHSEGSNTEAAGSNSHSEGSDTLASGVDSHAQNNSTVASGDNSNAQGQGSSATATNSDAGGHESRAYLYSSRTNAGGSHSIQGDSQLIEVVIDRSTTDATPTNLRPGNFELTMPTDTTWRFRVDINATQHAGASGTIGDMASFSFEGCIKNLAGTVSLVGSVVPGNDFSDAGASAWTVAVTANDTSNTLQVEATGEANKTIRWTASVHIVQVGIRNYA